MINLNLDLDEEVTIGLDFGTSTTKAAIGFGVEESHTERIFVSFSEGANSQHRLLEPTVAGFRDGELFFGALAEAEGLSLHKYIKMCLVCQDGKRDPRIRTCPNCLPTRPGHFGLDANTLISAEDLCALFCAIQIKHIEEVLVHIHPRNDPKAAQLHVAAPLDQIGYKENSLAERFIRVFEFARRMSSHAKNPWPLSEALEQLRLAKQDPIQEDGVRTTVLIPETNANIQSYISRRDVEPGHFMSIDVGAGSTDVTLFWLEKRTALRANYFHGKSHHEGMSNLSSLGRTDPQRQVVLERMRKAAIQNMWEGVIQRELPASDKNAIKNNDFVMLLSGGGSLSPPVYDIFIWEPLYPPWCTESIEDRGNHQHMLAPDETLVVTKGLDPQILRDHPNYKSLRHILNLCYGLASFQFNLAEWDAIDEAPHSESKANSINLEDLSDELYSE